MSELVPEPTLRDKIYELKGKHREAKHQARCKIQNAIQEALNEFQEETGGLFITNISLDITKHYRGRKCDMAVVSSMHLTSNIEENF